MTDFYDFEMVGDLAFNSTVVNGTPCYDSAYVVVMGLDYLTLAVTALLVVNLVMLAFVIMRVDLV